MGGSTLEVTNLPPDINDADFHHLFSLSGCLGSRLERDGGGRCAPADDLTPNTAPRLQTSLSPPIPIPFTARARASPEHPDLAPHLFDRQARRLP